MLQEPLNKFDGVGLTPAKRGDSIKPGVERSGTPGLVAYVRKSPRSGRQPFIMSKSQLLRYRTLRALGFLILDYPGVPLRSTPGFMLPPASRVLER